MRRLAAFAALVALLLLATAVAAPAADAPAVTTQAAKDVGQTQATLSATVDPKGTATSVHFDVGTTTAYGLQSASKDAGAGSGPVTVDIPIQGLTASTTYHVRAVATSAAGTTQGADVTFRTASPPPRPSVSTGSVRSIGMTTATLTGTVNPRGSATSFHFEYGPTTAYGTATAETAAGNGAASVAASVPVGGLAAGTTYHVRLVATSPAGTARGGDRSFKTQGTPTSATLTASADPVTFGRPVRVTGRLGGPRISGIRVRLQTTAFPFATPFADTGTPATTGRSGTYDFGLGALTQTTRFVVVADGAPAVLSPVVTVRCAVRTGITSVRRQGRRVAVAGRVLPATPHGVAALQRQNAAGRWLPLGRVHLGADGRYAFGLRARRRPLLVRVVGLPHDGGAHVLGASRTVRIAGRR